jgi:hypothetical protein
VIHFGIVLGVEVLPVTNDTQRLTTLPYKCLIPFRLSAPQLKIGMRHANSITGLYEKIEHHHRIQPATYSEQNPVACFSQPMPGDVRLKSFEHRSKLSIICCLTGFSNFAAG